MTSDPLWQQVQGKWKQLGGNAREEWGKLTDDDMMQVDGKREHLAGKIQERYGVTLEKAYQQIDAWIKKLPAQ